MQIFPGKHWAIVELEHTPGGSVQLLMHRPLAASQDSHALQLETQAPTVASHFSQTGQPGRQSPVPGSQVSHPAHVFGEQAPVDGSHVSQALQTDG